MPELPSGTVSFLVTDIERSTDLVHRLGDARYARLLTEHRRLLSTAFRNHGGQEIGARGDALLFAFPGAGEALAAAVEGQRGLKTHGWPEGAAPATRMGLHTGEPHRAADGYVGLDLHRATRICSAGHGGQILVSLTTKTLVEGRLPPAITLRSLGAHRLKDLQMPEALFQVLHPDLPVEFPPLASLNAVPNNLPRDMSTFIGRESEILEVKRLLGSTRLLMLTGSGGCGKTRLALRAAADVVERYPDGVWLVELGTVGTSDLVLQAVASALTVREAPGLGLLETVLEHVRTRRLLLVLDNCEHVVGACAEAAERLLRGSPHLRILATSREPLGVPGETVWRVPSLSVPARGVTDVGRLLECEAIRLFVERGAAVQPAFTLTARNGGAVAEVCRRLDGIPLAIELAAARLRALTVEQIFARLDQRFSLLTGGSRTALPRQQTLRGALDWSYDLLPARERVLFNRLAVFAGGWSLEAAERVCGGDGIESDDVLDVLTQLVFKSLVLLDGHEARVRYRLLETVRQYGLDRLLASGETRGVRSRHLAWCRDLVRRIEPELFGPRQKEWLDVLEAEHDNLRAALQFSASDEGDATAGLELAGGLWHFWQVRGYHGEGRRWLETMLCRGRDAGPAARAGALVGAGMLAWRLGDYPGSARLCSESLALFRELGDATGAGRALYVLGMNAESRGDYERAKALLTESLDLARRAGDKRRMAVSLNSIGEVARCQDDYEAARGAYEQSLALRREVGDRRGVAIAVGNLGRLALREGDGERARRLLGEALDLARQLMDKVGATENIAAFGGVAAAEGQYERAARLLGAADALLIHLEARLEPPDRREYEQSLAAARAGLSEAGFADAWARGRTMDLDEAIAYAVARDSRTPHGG